MRYAQVIPWLIGLTLFLVPSNAFLLGPTSTGYVRGLFVDYLVPKLYLSTLVAGVTVALSGWHNRHSILRWMRARTRVHLLAISLVTTVVLIQSTTTHPVAGLWFAGQLSIVILFGAVLATERKQLSSTPILLGLAAAVLFQTSLALYQYFSQSHALGYWLLGEPSLTVPTGLHTTSLGGVQRVLPYGTTPHPNVLAGVMVCYAFCLALLVQSRGMAQRFLQVAFLLLASCSVLLTQSASAAWLLMASTVFYSMRTRVGKTSRATRKTAVWLLIGLLMIVPLLLTQLSAESTSVARRNWLNSAALQMFMHNPLAGVGLNQFPAAIEDYTSSREVIRFLQPAHSVLLLLAAEGGILVLTALATFLLTAQSVWRWAVILTCLILSGPLALDHYPYTLPQGQFTLVLVLVTVRTLLGTRAPSTMVARKVS